MYKIAFCGAHGTGKTTLVNILAPELGISLIDKTIRKTYQGMSITDFEKCPPDLRAVIQNYLLLHQIEREDSEGKDGFAADRSVIDILAHVVADTSMSQSQFAVYETLVKERLKTYTHFVYLPIEFDVENEYLRANIDSRDNLAGIMKGYIDKWFKPDEYLIATGSVEQRLESIRAFLKK